uniref:CST complex subunit CTC1 n=1 Tax=Halocynthia roretzi TaxID=7729 RepID=Q8MXV9_HALRO|nr:HrPEN-2 protein [Halocynthia roretzi]
MENSEILEELHELGLCDTPDSRIWIEDLYKHIEDNIKPLISNEKSHGVFFEAIQQLLKADEQGTKHLPLAKKFNKISKIINRDEIIHSEISDLDYPHLNTSENESATTSRNTNCQNILIGVLSGGSVKSSLYLVDKSCRVICHMIPARPEYFNSVVMFCEWKLIPVKCSGTRKCKGFFEPQSEPIILHQQNEIAAIPCSIDSENITGYVVSVSSHVSFATWAFVIRILPHGQEKCMENLRYVFVHEEAIAFWSSCLFLGSEVKITDVQLRKIREGNSFFYIRVVSPNSRLFILKQAFPSAVSRDDVVKQIQLSIKNFGDLVSEQDGDICPVFVGEVTGIRSVEFGIYSLDNDNTLLFCTYLLSGPDISGGLRVGATVIVQNAHACKVNGTASLLCCTRSKVQVICHSATDSHWHATFLAGNTLLRSILGNKNLRKHPARLLSVAKLATELVENFSFLTMRSILPNHTFHVSPEESKNSVILERILFKNWVQPEKPKCRQGLLNEIVSSPHACVVKEAMGWEPTIARLVSPKELCELITDKANAYQELQKANYYWCSYKFNDDDIVPKNQEDGSWADSLVLLGVMEGEISHGRLQITDDKGSIQCLIYQDSDEDNSAPVIVPPCTNDIGSLVRINSFSVIVEKYAELLSPSQQIIDSSSSHSYNYHFYILCNVTDIEVLRRPYNIIQTCCWKLGCCYHQEDVDDSQTEEGAGPSKRLKSSLRSNTSVVHVKECIFFLKSITVGQRPIHQFVLSCLVMSVNPQSEIIIPTVELLFSGSMLKWKSFLPLHSLIKIEIPASDFAKDMTANENWKIEHLHVIPKNVEAHFYAAKKKYQKEKIFTVEEAKGLAPTTRVNLRGKIIEKSVFCDNDHMNFRDPSFHLKLNLIDEGDEKDQESKMISIFFGKLENQPVLNGILPGSIVIIHSIRIIISSRGFAYGKYDTGAMLVVERISPAGKKSPKKRIESSDPTARGDCSKERMEASSQGHPVSACMGKHDVPGCSTSDTENYGEIIIENLDPGTLLKKDEKKKRKISDQRKKCSMTSGEDEGSLPTTTIFSLYQILINNPQEMSRTKVFAMKLFPCLVLKVKIEKKITNGYQIHREISFYAKCVADDNTGRVIVHFDSSSIESFFRFIDVPSSLQNEIIELFLHSSAASIDFDCNLHDKNNLILDFPDLMKLKHEESTAQCIIITLFNNVKDSVMQLKRILVKRRITNTWKIADEYTPIFVPATVSVGSEDRDPYSSISLKTLNLNCIEVL